MLKIGDKIPSVELKILNQGDISDIETTTFFTDKKVVLFAIPGAFSSICTKNHIPSYVKHANTFKEHGIDAIVCLAVNDAGVLKAWGDSVGAHPYIQFLSDGSATLTKAMGMDIDLSAFGMGLRSKRYALLVDNGFVKTIQVEESPITCSISSAENILELLN